MSAPAHYDPGCEVLGKSAHPLPPPPILTRQPLPVNEKTPRWRFSFLRSLGTSLSSYASVGRLFHKKLITEETLLSRPPAGEEAHPRPPGQWRSGEVAHVKSATPLLPSYCVAGATSPPWPVSVA